ncbi:MULTISPECIES: hypothetical protein [unclassified Vibrio]|uniref:hypothetical protein n=1 Tax=unclassified Vibrio TaxID=2614977 RepID=UPI00354F0AA4
MKKTIALLMIIFSPHLFGALGSNAEAIDKGTIYVDFFMCSYLVDDYIVSKKLEDMAQDLLDEANNSSEKYRSVFKGVYDEKLLLFASETNKVDYCKDTYKQAMNAK